MPITTPTRTRAGSRQRKPAGRAKRAAVVPAESRERQPSPEAARALDLFAALRIFFAYDSQLAQALGWDEATAAKWRDRHVVRPQKAKAAQVLLLSELCEEARAYLNADSDVGEWLNAPLPNLRGNSPARWLRAGGRLGLKHLTHGMVDWMPRLPDGDLRVVDEHETTPLLGGAADQEASVREFERMLAQLG